MKTLSRMLVLLLALVATGTMPLLLASEPACVHDVANEGCGDCDDESPAAPCNDCAPGCSFCLCCPSRVVSTARFSVPWGRNAIDEGLPLSPTRAASRLECARIFHPPRA